MEDFGLVSIITPSYNSSRFISDMIESVMRQTYTNWELLITDDCSTDNSCEIINEYVKIDSRIRLFILEENSGAGIARNNSIRHAQGRFMAFLDSDDMWMPEKLQRQLSYMIKYSYKLTYTSYMLIDELDAITGIVVSPRKQSFFANKCDDKVGFSTAIYDVASIGKKYLPAIRKRQDWGLIMDILREVKMAYGLKEPLGYYRKGQESLSKNKLSLIKYNIAAYKSVLGWSSFKAYAFFCVFFIPSHIVKVLALRYINR